MNEIRKQHGRKEGMEKQRKKQTIFPSALTALSQIAVLY
jgi:hypothetical protein